MAGDGFRRRFTIKTSASETPMSEQEWRGAERLLAKLIAGRFAMDHPELSGPNLARVLDVNDTCPKRPEHDR